MSRECHMLKLAWSNVMHSVLRKIGVPGVPLQARILAFATRCWRSGFGLWWLVM